MQQAQIALRSRSIHRDSVFRCDRSARVKRSMSGRGITANNRPERKSRVIMPFRVPEPCCHFQAHYPKREIMAARGIWLLFCPRYVRPDSCRTGLPPISQVGRMISTEHKIGSGRSQGLVAALSERNAGKSCQVNRTIPRTVRWPIWNLRGKGAPSIQGGRDNSLPTEERGVNMRKIE